MGVNLLDVFRESVGDQTPVKISSYLGESTENTRSATGIAFSAILGGLIQRGQNLEGAASLLDFLHHEEIDGSILDKQEVVFGGGKDTTNLIEKGNDFLKYFAPDKNQIDKIVDIINSRSGVGRGSADTLLKLISPLVLGILGHQVKTKTLDSQGLSQLLLDQKKPVEAAAPAGMLDSLGYDVFAVKAEVKPAKKSGSSEEEDAEEEVSGGGQSLASRIVPWIILITAAAGLLYFMKSCGGRPEGQSLSKKMDEQLTAILDSTEEKSIKEKEGPPKVNAKGNELASASRNIADGYAIINLTDGKQIKVSENSPVDNFFRFVNEGGTDPYVRFTLDSITFYNKSANISLRSAKQLQQIVDILKAFPNVNIQIETYADLTNDAMANEKLASDRAGAIKTALEELGIASNRLTSVGKLKEVKEAAVEDSEQIIGNEQIDIFVTSM